MRAVLVHSSMQPERVLCAVSVSIVVDDPQSVSQLGRVHLWVQGVTGRTEYRQLGPVGAGILLSREVLVELGGREFLVSIGRLVFTRLQLILQFFDICHIYLFDEIDNFPHQNFRF